MHLSCNFYMVYFFIASLVPFYSLTNSTFFIEYYHFEIESTHFVFFIRILVQLVSQVFWSLFSGPCKYPKDGESRRKTAKDSERRRKTAKDSLRLHNYRKIR